MRCQGCGEATLSPKRRRVAYAGVPLGRFTLLVCPVCGFEAVDEAAARRIDAAIEAAWHSRRIPRPQGAKGRGVASLARLTPRTKAKRASPRP